MSEQDVESAGQKMRARGLYPSYLIEGSIYLVDPQRERMFRFDGQTTNPRVIALADAVAFDDGLYTVHVDGKEIRLQHHHAGIRKTLHATELLDQDAGVFVEEGRLQQGDVADLIDGGEVDV